MSRDPTAMFDIARFVVVAFPCTRRFPVVVAPPKMVRPVMAVPPPMVEDAVERSPEVVVSPADVSVANDPAPPEVTSQLLASITMLSPLSPIVSVPVVVSVPEMEFEEMTPPLSVSASDM